MIEVHGTKEERENRRKEKKQNKKGVSRSAWPRSYQS
jgi:hypothetical protein